MVSQAVEITFSPDAERTPARYSLLRRIRCDGSPGSWPPGTRHVEIIRELGGGRSGGCVLLADIHHSPSRSLCVIKIDRTQALTREWTAYERHVEPLNAALFAPIIAATPDVVAGTADLDDLAAVVYREASDYTGQSGDAVRTLAEIVAAADGDAAALLGTLKLLDHTLRGAAGPLHEHYSLEPSKRSLRFLNPTLGPSLGLRTDEYPADAIADDEVLRRTLGGFDGDLRPDDRLRLRDLAVDGELLAGQEITLAGEGTVRDLTSVSGTVLWSRGRQRRALLLDAVKPSEVTDQWWRVGDVVVADPFAALENVLTEPVENRVYSRSHGDLNVGNIVVVGNHSCFIDYALTTDRAPQQADHAWLEVSFLRDRFADLSFDEIVRVQRALGVSSRLLHFGISVDEARDRGRVLLREVGRVAFEVLFVIRKWAHNCYPHAVAGPEWWRDHLCHLLISTHRSLKWTGTVQSEGKLRAMAATAAVATEWLADSSPFAHWRREDREHAIAELRPCLVARNAQVIQEVLTTLQSDHDRFIDLLAADEATVPASVPSSAVSMAEQAGTVVLLGEPQSGKTSVLREVAYRVAAHGTRIPVLLHAQDISSPLLNRDTLYADAVYVFVDGLDEVVDRDAAVAALVRLHEDHPDLRILVCAQISDDLPFHKIRLAKFDEDAILAHLYRNAPASAVPGLLHTLLDDPLWTALDLRRPRSLAILDQYIRAGELPASPSEAHERMLRTALGDAGFNRAVDLAAHLLDGETAGLDQVLVDTTVIVPDREGMRFAEPSDQYLLAALALRGQPVAEAVSRTAVPAWDGALRALLALPDTPQEVVHGVVGAILDEDPVRAGLLLRAAHTRPPDLVSSFATAQQEALRHNNYADGLAAFGCPLTVAGVVADQDADVTARLTGLALLERMVDDARPGADHRQARADLTEAVRAVLGGSAAPELLSYALDGLGRSRLRGLELYAAAHLTPSHPWPVVRSAANALRELGVVLTEPARQDYHCAVRTRLNDVIDTLWNTTDPAIARWLGKERYALVATLAEHPSSLDVLLRHRFAFDITSITPLLDRYVLVTAQTDPASLLTQVRDGMPDQAITAAHQLLRDWPGHESQVLERVGRDPDLHRLLIAAAALTPSCAKRAEEIFLGVLPHIEADRIEGLSALLVAIFQADRGRGVRLAWAAAHVLTERDLPERLYWPWKVALARCRGGIDDLDLLLCGDDIDAALAVEALGTWDVLGTGRPGPGTLSPGAEESLWRAHPEIGASPAEIDNWARAVSAVGLARAVPHLRLLAEAAGDASVTVSTSTGIHEIHVADVARDAVAHLTRSIQDGDAAP